MAYTQDNRLLNVSPPGGAVMFLTEMKGREAVSELFNFKLDLIAEDSSVSFDSMVGAKIGFKVRLPDGQSWRLFHGNIKSFSYVGSQGPFTHYRAEVVPWLWFLTKTTDCRIYQTKTVLEIIKDVFSRHGLTDFEDQTTGSHTAWDYCVQYRETAFNFVSRLMEEEGIFYFFKHEESRHVLVLADASSAHQPCPEVSSARFAPNAEGAFTQIDSEEDVVTDWMITQELRSGKCTVRDWNFEKPLTNIASAETPSIINQGGNSAYELYDYPAEYEEKADGDAIAKLWMEEEEVEHAVAEGEGTVRTLQSGFKFTLKEHPRDDQNCEYMLTVVEHAAWEPAGFLASGAPRRGDDELPYTNSFECIKADVVFRPAATTEKPLIQGSQTAIVVGKSGEEIWTDKYGRVKVQFHWDRVGEKNENSSCWVRVSQTWAGKTWGAMHVPRIGQEVVVDFLEGDPDRPIIIGRVYNADHTVPYDLPANPTQSGIKSRSSKSGTAENFNELRFEDKKDEEEIYFHAEKNFTRVVENNDTLTVGTSKKDAGDQTITIHNHRTSTLKEGNETLTIEKGKRTETIKLDDELTIQDGNKKVTVSKGDMTVTVTSGKIEVSAGTSIELKVSGSTIKIDAMSITLKTGSSEVKLDATGVSVKGGMIKIEGTGMAEMKSPMTTVKGDGMLTLKGGMTMIN